MLFAGVLFEGKEYFKRVDTEPESSGYESDDSYANALKNKYWKLFFFSLLISFNLYSEDVHNKSFIFFSLGEYDVSSLFPIKIASRDWKHTKAII